LDAPELKTLPIFVSGRRQNASPWAPLERNVTGRFGKAPSALKIADPQLGIEDGRPIEMQVTAWKGNLSVTALGGR
jgi:hypothetical protein